jgi:hypothetical protein
MILKGKSKEFGEKAIPMPHSPPQIQHGLTWEQTWASIGEKLVTNRLVYGTTYMNPYKICLNQKFWTSGPVFFFV